MRCTQLESVLAALSLQDKANSMQSPPTSPHGGPQASPAGSIAGAGAGGAVAMDVSGVDIGQLTQFVPLGSDLKAPSAASSGSYGVPLLPAPPLGLMGPPSSSSASSSSAAAPSRPASSRSSSRKRARDDSPAEMGVSCPLEPSSCLRF